LLANVVKDRFLAIGGVSVLPPLASRRQNFDRLCYCKMHIFFAEFGCIAGDFSDFL